MPRSRETITGVQAFVNDMHLTPADARRLRREGFISFTVQPIRGPQTAGVTNVALYETPEGARHSLAHELRPDVIRALGPVENLRFFPVPGIPGARGWTASLPGEPASRDVGNVFWVQGRCMLVLGNQGPGPFVGPLSTGARAIFDRTNRQCPCNDRCERVRRPGQRGAAMRKSLAVPLAISAAFLVLARGRLRR